MGRPLYSIVIPFYNEERQAAFVIQRILDYCDGEEVDAELILVDNGSRDRTGMILASCAHNPRVRTVSLRENAGLGGGVLAGMRIARGEYVGFTTAGGQVLPEYLIQIFDTARKNPHAVCKAKRISRENILRKFTGYGYSLLASALFSVWIPDVNGHPLVLAREDFDALDIQSTNFAINIEILTKARRRGMRIVHVAIPYQRRVGGKSHVTFATAGLMFRQLLAFWKDSLFLS
ncbi:glycosyltransferase family 2 protein [Candidatus Parcubacteria bacterium]|nr:glycosyltransferase family 2 protein [Candidatus Parcubacteria bacterium]